MLMWQPGQCAISFRNLDKDRKPIDAANPIISLISNYAVAAFNEAIEMVWINLCAPPPNIFFFCFYLMIIVNKFILSVC